MNVALAATYHDPDGRLYDQSARVLPALARIFAGIAVQASYASQQRSVALLGDAGALVRQETKAQFSSLSQLGEPRRNALELALRLAPPAILFCDFDRALHWAERYPEELARVVAGIPERDLTVFGRTDRAFTSHPCIQRDTEAIINRVYATVSGCDWDVTAAARGLSRRAATAIFDGCPERSIGTDVAWPLYLQREGGFTLGYVATEGLEFETADRYADQVAQAGGLAGWLARLDADPRQWAMRLELARLEVVATAAYVE